MAKTIFLIRKVISKSHSSTCSLTTSRQVSNVLNRAFNPISSSPIYFLWQVNISRSQRPANKMHKQSTPKGKFKMPGKRRRYNVRFPPVSKPSLSNVLLAQRWKACFLLCSPCLYHGGQGRIKKIMQKDTEVGRMAMAVPVLICILFAIVSTVSKPCVLRWKHVTLTFALAKVLEMFLRSLLTKANFITQSRHSRTLSVTHV